MMYLNYNGAYSCLCKVGQENIPVMSLNSCTSARSNSAYSKFWVIQNYFFLLLSRTEIPTETTVLLHGKVRHRVPGIYLDSFSLTL